jgi:FkbM family methyltransferase
LKSILKTFLRHYGLDLIRYAPDTVKPLNVLELAVRLRLQLDNSFFFVQIGANDGIRHDPLRELVLKYHLPGVLVEPLPDLFTSLQANYAAEPQLRFENVAIAPTRGEMTLYRFHEDAPVHDDLHGVATADAQQIRQWARDNGSEEHVVEVTVPCITLPQLLQKHHVQHITLLQVDTEGLDYAILQMAFKAKVFPEMINFEFLHLSPDDRLNARRLLIQHGYSLCDGYIDTFALRDDLEWLKL